MLKRLSPVELCLAVGNTPWSVVRNVTVRSNVIRHVAAVFNISGWDDIYTARQTENISIENNLVYDVSTPTTFPGTPPTAGSRSSATRRRT